MCECAGKKAAISGEIVVIEASNPGPVGVDTGEVFRSNRTGQLVRVVAKVGERKQDAVARVKARHG